MSLNTVARSGSYDMLRLREKHLPETRLSEGRVEEGMRLQKTERPAARFAARDAFGTVLGIGTGSGVSLSTIRSEERRAGRGRNSASRSEWRQCSNRRESTGARVSREGESVRAIMMLENLWLSQATKGVTV